MSFAGSAYSVTRSAGACSHSGVAFAPGERFIAALAEREDGTLERVDYSTASWEAGARPSPPLRLFATWRATYQEASPSKRTLMGDEELIDLFGQLAEADQPRQVAFRYVLCLLLIRRRLLKVAGSRPRTAAEPGALLVVYKGQDSDLTAPLAVTDPGLDDAAVSEVIEQLGQVLPGVEAARTA
mgnify:FL=1